MLRPLGVLIPTTLPSEDDWKIKLLQSWQQIMGTLACKVRLEKIEDEYLVLGVFDACWMQELYLLTPMLLTNINQSLDRPRIKTLRFKRVGMCTRVPNTVQKKRSAAPTPRLLTARETRALDTIVDRQLRDALVDFLQRCSRENR